MQMTLLSITVCLTHFLIVSSYAFNTPPTNTQSIYTEATISTETNTETNQELEIPIDTTASSPPVTTTQDNPEMTSLANDAQTQTILTPNVTSTEETSLVHQFNISTESQNDIMDAAKTERNLTATTISLIFTRLSQQKDDKNETGRTSSAHNTSLNNDGHSNMSYIIETQTTSIWDTSPVKQATSEPSSSVQTVFWEERTVSRNESDVENYEMSSTQTTFANSDKELERTQDTTGSLTTEHMVLMHTEKRYNTTPDATHTPETPTMENNWITSQNTDIPTNKTAYTILNDTAVNHNSTPVFVVKSGDATTQQSINKITNSRVHTEREKRISLVTLDTPRSTANNSSIITNVVTDSKINATSIITDTENDLCFNTNIKQTQNSRLVCFITLWTLAMTASVFLGISIFLWVRLSVLKKKVKFRGRGQEREGQKWEKESLWADPQASVQERVEFWYVNGSTLEADRKERKRRREEINKRMRQQPNKTENELWIQPRVTVDDLTEFWYANRRMKEGVV